MMITGALAANNPARAGRDRTIAVDRLTSGLSYRQLADKYGISKSTVCEILNNDQAKDVIDTGRRKMASMIPKAVDNVWSLLDSEDSKIRLETTKIVLQATDVIASHAPSPLAIQINTTGDVHITQELSQLQSYLKSTWSDNIIDVQCDSTDSNHTNDTTYDND
jgi:hypothetical protein